MTPHVGHLISLSPQSPHGYLFFVSLSLSVSCAPLICARPPPPQALMVNRGGQFSLHPCSGKCQLGGGGRNRKGNLTSNQSCSVAAAEPIRKNHTVSHPHPLPKALQGSNCAYLHPSDNACRRGILPHLAGDAEGLGRPGPQVVENEGWDRG